MEEIIYNPFDSLVFLTNRVGRLLTNTIEKRSITILPNLKKADMGLLVNLWMKDGVRQQDLASSIIKDKGTIARAINRMERENLVVRVSDEQDKRTKRIYLTNKGKEMKNCLIPLASEIIAQATEELNAEEIEVCKKVLIVMYNKLNS